VKPGDLVKMKRGYPALGVVLSDPFERRITPMRGPDPRWVRVLWPDYGQGLEKERDLEIVR